MCPHERAGQHLFPHGFNEKHIARTLSIAKLPLPPKVTPTLNRYAADPYPKSGDEREQMNVSSHHFMLILIDIAVNRC